MKIIDLNKPLGLRVKGISYGRWNTLVTTPSNFVKGNYTDQEVLDALSKQLDQLSDAVNQAYEAEAAGYIQLGNASINILRFDALEFVYVQDEQEVLLELQ